MTQRTTLLARCLAVRAALYEDHLEAEARRAIGAPLDGYGVAEVTWRLHLRSLQWELVRLRRARGQRERA